MEVPTLLLHGFTGSANSWSRSLLDGLGAGGRRVRPLDLPGHGDRAGEGDVNLEAAIASIEEAASLGEAGSGPFDLVGYSMGGRIALHYAVRRPDRVRRLVLESSSPGLSEPEERAARRAADEALAERVVEEGIEAFVEAWESMPLLASQRELPEPARAAHRASRLANDPAGLAASLRGLGTGALPSLWDRLPALDVPTLLIAGELDAKFVSIGRAMERRLPDARLVAVGGAGHTVHLEQPQAWLDAVMDFLG